MEPDRWLGLDLRHLVALKTIADEGSFGRAAEKLGYTQSAISQQIATLERIVGMRLIERPGGPRPISLTEAGAILLRHADAIQARLLAAKADMKALEAGDAGRLRIGTFQSVGTRILPTLLRRFSDAHPDVEVVLQESSDERELLDLVERGELDLTFWTLPVSAGPYESVELLRLIAGLAGLGRLAPVLGDKRLQVPHLGKRRYVDAAVVLTPLLNVSQIRVHIAGKHRELSPRELQRVRARPFQKLAIVRHNQASALEIL